MSWARPEDIPAASELILAVPAPLLSWHQVELPKLAAHRWRAALDALLEEQLLVDAAELHLALAPGSQSGQEVTVAACDKAWLSRALQALEQAGHEVMRIVPEFEPGPASVHLLGQPERGWLVECRPQQVLALPLSHPVAASLQAWRSLHPQAPGGLTAEPALAGAAEATWEQSPQVVQAAEALRRAAEARWNLAQFEFAAQASWRRLGPRTLSRLLEAPAWRPLRWGLAALLAVQVLGLQAWAWKERRELQARQDEVRALLTRTFPEVRLVLDPVRQMERETERLMQTSGQASAGDLPRMLAALGPLAGAARNLDYKPGELTLTGWQPAPAAASEAQALLQQRGYRLQAQGGAWVLREALAGAAP